MQQDTSPCNLCGTKIITRCLDIHTRACSKRFSKSEVKKSTVRSNPLDLIPCAQCGEMVDFNVFTIHMEECVGRQLMKCNKCKLLYPTFLFEEHSNVCEISREEQPEAERGILQLEDFEEDEDLGQMIMHLAINNSKEHSSEPLDLNEINKIKKYMLNKSEQCSICYCEITKNSMVIRLHCPHKFHTRCLTAWLQKNPQCPMCRRHALH